MQLLNIYISQGSVATRLGCGETISMRYLTTTLLQISCWVCQQRIPKISQHLAKTQPRVWWLGFFTHGAEYRPIKESEVIENVDFQGFRTLRRRHLRKWDQHYYIVLFSSLSPFHWPETTWPWMTLNGHFTLNFHYNEQPFENLCLHTYLWACLYHVTSGDVRKRTVIRRIFGIRARIAELRIFRRRYIVGTLTNRANISI